VSSSNSNGHASTDRTDVENLQTRWSRLTEGIESTSVLNVGSGEGMLA
jgi:hypothetical protein